MTQEEMLEASDSLARILDGVPFEETAMLLIGQAWALYLTGRPEWRQKKQEFLDKMWRNARQRCLMSAAQIGSGESFEDFLCRKVKEKGREPTNRELIALHLQFRNRAGRQ